MLHAALYALHNYCVLRGMLCAALLCCMACCMACAALCCYAAVCCCAAVCMLYAVCMACICTMHVLHGMLCAALLCTVLLCLLCILLCAAWHAALHMSAMHTAMPALHTVCWGWGGGSTRLFCFVEPAMNCLASYEAHTPPAGGTVLRCVLL